MKKSRKNTRQESQHTQDKKKEAFSEKDLDRLEFHRHAMALMPEPADKTRGVVFYVDGDKSKLLVTFKSVYMVTDSYEK